MAHRRQLKCVIIVRISQTHKYNDLRLSKLPATNEINRVPSEFEIIWNGGWWEMIHLSCYLWNSNIEIYPPTLVHSHCSPHPVEFIRALWALPPSSTFADRPPLSSAPLGSARLGAGQERLTLFTSVDIPAIIFFQETLMCLKVRWILT